MSAEPERALEVLLPEREADRAAELDELGIAHEAKVMSAHRTPDKVLDYASGAEARGIASDAVARGNRKVFEEIGLEFARYVKIQDVPESEGGVGTFDLDAVGIVNAGCR